MNLQDAMFISVEDERNPMHIGTMSVFEGPAPSYGDLVRTVAAHLPNLPRYQQRVRFIPMGLGRPVRVDDPYFQILLYHVRHSATPPPGSAEPAEPGGSGLRSEPRPRQTAVGALDGRAWLERY